MPLLLGLSTVGAPRLALLCMWVSRYPKETFMTYIWPFVGFCIIPYTTIVYTLVVNTWGHVGPPQAMLVTLGFAADFVAHNGLLLAALGEIEAYQKRIS